MFDYVNTKYEDAILIINENTAPKAIDIINKTIEEKGETPELLCYLSKAYLYLKDLEKSLEYAQKALNLDENYLYAKARIILAYSKLNEPSKAIDLFFELKYNKNINILILYIILIFVDDHLYDSESLQIISEHKSLINNITINDKINSFELKFIIYIQVEIEKNLNNLLNLLKIAEKYKKTDDEIYACVGFCLLHSLNKDYKKTLRIFNKSLKINKKNHNSIDFKTQTFIVCGKFNKALKFLNTIENPTKYQKSLKDALEIFPKPYFKNIYTMFLIGLGLYARKQYKFAELFLLLSNNTNEFEYHFILFKINVLEKNYASALKYLKGLWKSLKNKNIYKSKSYPYRFYIIKMYIYYKILSLFKKENPVSNYDKVIKTAAEYNIISPELYNRANEIFGSENDESKKYLLLNKGLKLK